MTYMTQGLHRAVQSSGKSIATIFESRTQTFEQLADRTARLAGALQKLGMKTNDSVAMLAQNSDRYIEYLCGVPWGGGILNPCNTRWSVGELAYSIGDAGSRMLIVDEQFKGFAEKLRENSCNIDRVIYCGDGEMPSGMLSYENLVAEAAPVPDVMRKGDDLLGIFYTGGTTGFPKGVMLTHGNVWAAATQMLCEGLYPKGSISLEVAPMFHIAGMATTFANIIRGNVHLVIPAFVPAMVLQAIEKHRATDATLVPTMIQMLVDQPDFKKYDVGSLRRIAYGASPISEGVLSRAIAGFPKADFTQGYGQTELGGVCTLLGGTYHTGEGFKQGKLCSAGQSSLCVELRVIDGDGNEMPRGTVGEVVVRGPTVMAGYWKKPAETAAAFTADGWLRTGDCAYMDDQGFVFIVDRLKDMIVSGGENVFSVEVESVISTHPAVAQCAVIGIPSDQWGEAVHAVIVLKENAKVAEDDIKSHCKKRIAGYKCPQSIEFRQELPISGAGKVLKRNLREPFWRDLTRRVA